TTAHTPKKKFPSVSALNRMITPRWTRVLTFGLRCLARRERGAAWGSSRTDPAFRRWGCTPRAPNREFIQVVPRQALKYSQVALRRRVDDLLRQRRRRWLAGPASLGDEGIEVVPNRLLVQRRLRPAGDVALPRPESGRVRGQHLVDQEERAVRGVPELELRVRNDDVRLGRDDLASLVEREAQATEGAGERVAEPLPHGVERDVLVVALLGLGGRGEDRRVEALALDQAGRQRLARQGAAPPVLGPGRAGEVAADHAFDRDRARAPDQHRTPRPGL